MRYGILLASVLWTLSAPAQQPQPADAAVANDYCDAVIHNGTCYFSGRGQPLPTSKRDWPIWTPMPSGAGAS